MANQQGNGRNVAVPDENRPSWRPQDENGARSERGVDQDRYLRDRDDDRHMRDRDRFGSHWDDRSSRWDRDEGYRSTERYGQGQSGYGGGRYEEDRSYSSRNMGYPSGMEERARERGLDERFSQGRGGSSWSDRGERWRDERQVGGGGYGHGGYEPRAGYPSQPSQRMSAREFGDEEWGNEGYTSRQPSSHGNQRGYGATGHWRQPGQRPDRDWQGGEGEGWQQREWQGGPGPSWQQGDSQGGPGWQQGGQGQGWQQGREGQGGRDRQRTQGGLYGGRMYGGGRISQDTQDRYGQQASQVGGRGAQGQGGLYGQGGYNEGMYGQGGMQDRFGSQGYQGWSRESGAQTHRGKGPSGYMRSDERIREMVCEALSDDPDVDATNIEVTVKSGEVLLSGTVEDRQQKRVAEDVVDQVSGVKDIQNQIRVSSERKAPGKEAGVGAKDISSRDVTAGKESESQPTADKRHRA